MRILLPALCLAAAVGLNTQAVAAPHPIQVLIITGQDKHPWRETTPYLREEAVPATLDWAAWLVPAGWPGYGFRQA